MCHPALQIRRSHCVAIGSDSETAALDEERGFLGLVEEAEKRKIASKRKLDDWKKGVDK